VQEQTPAEPTAGAGRDFPALGPWVLTQLGGATPLRTRFGLRGNQGEGERQRAIALHGEERRDGERNDRHDPRQRAESEDQCE
jgi:hypothetical protein